MAKSHADTAGNVNGGAYAGDLSEPLQVCWDDDDLENPHSMGTCRKWAIILLVASTTLCYTCTSSLYTSTYDQITVEFDCSEIVATVGLSLFIGGLGLGPMVLAPLSEFYGRKPVYVVSLLLFVIWIVPCALAHNIQTMLVARFVSGFVGAAFTSVAGGTVGDLFTKNTLLVPMMVYSASPFIGASLGPVIGGLINQNISWRWSFYILLIWAFFQWIMVCLFVPETYHPVLLRDKARKLRKETGDERWRAPIEKIERSIPSIILRSIYRPFMLLVLEPMCLSLCLFSAIILGIQYLFFGAFGVVFRNNHNFELWQVGLTFSGISVGMLAAVATVFWWEANYLRLVKQREASGGEPGVSEPEYRLPPAIAGAPLVTIGLFWFGWTTYSSIHWIMPIVGSAFFGAGIILVFSGIFTFLVDAYPVYAASALGANSLSRGIFAAAFPLFGVQMYNKLGYQWATSVLAFLSLAMAPFPYVFYKYGKKIRSKSRFASVN